MNKPTKKVTPQKQQPKQSIPSGPFHFKGNGFHAWVILVITTLCFISYGNSISNGFSLDDEFVMRGDTIVQKGVNGIPELFKTRYAWDQKGSYGYRPVVKASYSIEYAMFGKSPHVGHTVNIFLYAGLCIFLFYFLRKIFYAEVGDYFLFIVVGLFVVHPMHTEVVDSLKNRDILMVCLFGFYTCYAYVKAFETGKLVEKVLWILSAMLAFDLAFLCKPDALMFIAITAMVLFFYNKGSFKQAGLSLVFIIVGILALRAFVHHVLPHSDYHRTFIFIENPLLRTHWYQRINLGFYTFWFYIQKLIFPFGMACYYGYKEVDPQPALTDINVIIGLLLAIALCYLIYRNRKDRGIVMFSLLLFSGGMFAYSDVLAVGPGIVADRFIFLPSLAFILLATLLVFYLLKLPITQKPMGNRTNYLYMIGSVVLIVYSGRTIARNPDWKSHLSIYQHDAKVATKSAKLHSLLASADIQLVQDNPNMPNDEKVKYYQDGEAHYMASIDIYPEYTTSLNNLGMIQFNFYRDYDKALDFFGRAIKVDTNYTEALFNMGATNQAKGNNKLAEYYFLRTIKSNPEYEIAYIFISRLYFNESRLDDVLKVNQEAIDKGHVINVASVNMGNVYLAKKDTLKAVGYFEKAVAYSPKSAASIAQFLTKYYALKGDMDKAKYYNKLYQDAQPSLKHEPDHDSE
jgi:Tfp pilus assembly protein PilF